MSDWQLSSGTVEFRQAERDHANGRDRSPRRKVQAACDRCTQGVMDATNDHLLGRCECECHKEINAAAGVSPETSPAAAKEVPS